MGFCIVRRINLRFASILALAIPLNLVASSLTAAPLTNGECLLLAQASQRRNVGSVSAPGARGVDGQDGADTDDLTVFSDGSPMTLNLAGRDGAPGTPGAEGSPANCPALDTSQRQDVQMANGSDGGDGGDGGNGGNGGSITIYTRNLDSLSQIFVGAAGGKGGAPGMGGGGGQACQCSQPYWTVENCSGRPGDSGYRCSTEEFRCFNGLNGRNGRSGIAGQDGLPGRLTVLNLDRPLEPDRPGTTVTLDVLKNQGFNLSKNIWETRPGAAQLLAPGSVIADEYLILLDRIERSFLVVWNAPQPFERFANTNVSLTLTEDNQIAPELPGNLWLEGTTQQRNNVTEFVVYNAMWEGDATSLGRLTLSGSGNNLQLSLVDEANQSNLMATKFRLRYRVTNEDPRFRPPSTYTLRYEGEVEDSLVTVNGNQFTIDIGQLPIPPKDLESGTGVEIELVAERTFSGNTAEQKLIIRDLIRGRN